MSKRRGKRNKYLLGIRTNTLKYLKKHQIIFDKEPTNDLLFASLSNVSGVKFPDGKEERYTAVYEFLCSQGYSVIKKQKSPSNKMKFYYTGISVHGSNSKDFYSTKEWRIVRYEALKLHGGSCQCCGAKPTPGNPLHVDHIKPRSKYPKLELKLDNLQVLCEDCNLGKLAWDETDWRPKEDEIVNLVFTVVREG